MIIFPYVLESVIIKVKVTLKYTAFLERVAPNRLL